MEREPEVQQECVLKREGLDLTPMQTAFVYNYVANGGVGRTAARDAGYAPSGADGCASRMLRNPMISKAIFTVSAQTLGNFVPRAMSRVMKLSCDAKSEYVQLEACRDVLDRAGFSAPKRVDVSGTVSVTVDLT